MKQTKTMSDNPDRDWDEDDVPCGTHFHTFQQIGTSKPFDRKHRGVRDGRTPAELKLLHESQNVLRTSGIVVIPDQSTVEGIH